MSDPAQTAPRDAPERPRPVTVPGGAQQRQLGLALLGLALMVGAAFGFWFLLQSVDQRQSYVVAARDIARWEPVQVADFRLVDANIGDAAATMPDQMGAVYGQWAIGPIPAGTFITPDMFRAPPLSSGSEASSIIIRINLPSEDVTYGTLESGDRVALIGRESLFDPAQGDVGPAAEAELSLLGVLTLENVQGDEVVYVVEPAEALRIQSLVRRYLASTDRQIWRLGVDLTTEDIVRALGGGEVGGDIGADADVQSLDQ